MRGKTQIKTAAPEQKSIRLILQYDGTDYAGWQVQPEGKTIQGTLESVIMKLAPDSSRLIAAGRTDAGVHALEQVAAFRTSSPHSPEVFKNAINAQIPRDIRIIHADYCDSDFHPRYDARGKIYSYLIGTGTVVSPFIHRFIWPVKYRLDFNSMKEASIHLLGRHDFSSFQASGCSANHPVREIRMLELKRRRSLNFLNFALKGNFIVMRIEANAFLRHMVRNIAGTLVEAGRGAITPKEMKKILSAKDRTRSGPTAPAQGLFLERIFY